MKIPKTFIPEKNLKEKTDDLLEGKIKKETQYIIDEEASCLFPNFIDHLKEIYSTLVIQKESHNQWEIFGSHHPNVNYQIGIIKKYAACSEYGYNALIIIHDQELVLNYREGYYSYDINGKLDERKDPKRQDSHGIPFP